MLYVGSVTYYTGQSSTTNQGSFFSFKRTGKTSLLFVHVYIILDHIEGERNRVNKWKKEALHEIRTAGLSIESQRLRVSEQFAWRICLDKPGTGEN